MTKHINKTNVSSEQFILIIYKHDVVLLHSFLRSLLNFAKLKSQKLKTKSPIQLLLHVMFSVSQIPAFQLI